MDVIDIGSGRVSLERSGDGPDILLLHSLLTDRHAFAPVLDAIGSHWTVNRVDLPGFGDTTAVAPSVDAQADAVAGLLEVGGYDPEKTAVLGNGWGAFVALGAAIRHGHLFDRLVLVGCGPCFPPPAKSAFAGMIDAVESGGMETVVDPALRRIFPEDYISTHPEAAAERRQVLLRTRPEAFVSACRALVAVDYTSMLGEVTNPTLMIVGSRDEATPPEMAGEVAAGIDGAVLVEMKDVGHAPQLQDPARFVEAVAGFLGL